MPASKGTSIHMDDNSTGGKPPVTPAVTPAAATPDASSSTVQLDQQPLRTPLDLRRAIEQMKAGLPKPGSQQPKSDAPAPVAEAPAAEATPVETATETAPEGSETPEAASTDQTAETAPEVDSESANDDDSGEGPVNPLTGKRAHLRLNENDELGNLALAFKKRNRDWTLDQAMEAARNQLGIKPKQEAEAPAETVDPKVAALPKTVDEVDSLTTKLLADYKKAMSEVRFEDAADMQTQLMQLSLHRSQLERRAEQEQVAKAQKYDADFDASNAKAVDLYPFASDPATAGHKRMAQIDAQLKANDDPLYYSPNKPLKLAQMVAAELNIAPRNKNAAPAKAAVPAVPQPKKGVVPSGSSRTTPPAQNQPAVDPAISNIKNMVDLRAQLKRFGVKA